jgi:broad specificity phosphatase PhoE
MKWFLLVTFLLFGSGVAVLAGEKGEMFTIYLARHAEKKSAAENPLDPPLTACGERRAEALAIMLREVKLEHVYSTPFLRTRNTAFPAASSHGLEIKDYDPANLDGFARLLLDRKQSVFVIGHSDTTAILAGLLSGSAGEAFSEDEYDRLYLVTVSGDQRQLILLDQGFHCDER